MSYERKDNSGALWPNDRREHDRHPHLKGQAKIGGKEYWVSAWSYREEGKFKWLSLSFQEKEQQPEQKPVSAVDEDLNDPVPF